MNEWQSQFARKIESLRGAAAIRFEHLASDVIELAFADFREFTGGFGITCSAPVMSDGIRTFKFAIVENAYVLVKFRLSGLELCEVVSEFFVPHSDNIEAPNAQVDLNEVTPDWVSRQFEKTLDCFVDAFQSSLGTAGKAGGKQKAMARV